MEEILLNSNMNIPMIGLGTWQIIDRESMRQVLSAAYKIGYRLIDTAAAYSNEKAIAKAIEDVGINRNEIILSNKVWNTNRGFEEVQEACRKSLKKCKTDYFDIYLMHWPASMKLHDDWADINAETWRGMEQLYRDGLVRSIGVCNFTIRYLEQLMRTATVVPCINQIEFHPGMNQLELMEYCSRNGIQIEGSSPLGNGQILSNSTIINIANAHDKTPAQVCIRWGVQKNVIMIPKTINESRLLENISVFDFELTKDEMMEIDDIPYCGGLGFNSEEITQYG